MWEIRRDRISATRAGHFVPHGVDGNQLPAMPGRDNVGDGSGKGIVSGGLRGEPK